MNHVTRLVLSCLAVASALPTLAQHSPSLSGDWSGTLAGLTITAHLQDPATGPRTATLDIPAQNALGLPLVFSGKADSVYLRLAVANALFAGRRSADGQALVGLWQQKGQAIPFMLRRVAAGTAARAAPRRPSRRFLTKRRR